MARCGMSAEEWDYHQSRKEAANYNPTDPSQNSVKHVYVHGGNETGNGRNHYSDGNNQLRKRIDAAISKILDLNILESDKKDLIKTLTGAHKV